MITECVVYDPMYSKNNKRFMKFELPPECSKNIDAIHNKRPATINPLVGNVLCVKVPWRYNRVMCQTTGRNMYEAKRGDIAHIEIEYTGLWDVDGCSGHTWKLKSINL